MEMNSLHELMLEEMRSIYHGEQQLVKALPDVVEAACHPELSQAVQKHLDETRTHVARLEEAFRLLDVRPDTKKNKAIEEMIGEAASVIKKKGDIPDAVLDAALICEAQKVEHFEIAVYGTLCTYSRMMGHDQVTRLFEATIAEEQGADTTLTEIAESGVNEEALAGAM